MLTMLNNSAKEKAIKEYLRVLKPGGRLLTHDVSYQDEDTAKLIDQQVLDILIEVICWLTE